MKAQVASLYQAVDLQQEIPPLIIGERANSNGSKKFRELLLADDFQACLRIAADQESRGAQVIVYLSMAQRAARGIPLMSASSDCFSPATSGSPVIQIGRAHV